MCDSWDVPEFDEVPRMEKIVLTHSVLLHFSEQTIGAQHGRMASPVLIHVLKWDGVEYDVSHHSVVERNSDQTAALRKLSSNENTLPKNFFLRKKLAF